MFNQSTSESAPPTETEIPDTVFTFEYDHGNQALRITFKGGDQPAAGELLVRSSDGTQARWNELGSTSVTESEDLSEGETGSIGGLVINWEDPVSVGERVKIIYRPTSNSPATIAEFDTETAVTATSDQNSTNQTDQDSTNQTDQNSTNQTDQDSTNQTDQDSSNQTGQDSTDQTPPPTDSDATLFAEQFADGNHGDRWTIGAVDDETIQEEDGYLLHDSPKRYNDGGEMRSIESLTAEGVQTITVKQKTRIAEYWGFGFGITDGDVEIDLVEHQWEDNNDLMLTGGAENNYNLATATTSTELIEYAVTIDFESQTVTQVTRNGETYDTNYTFAADFDKSYDIHLGEGRGHEVEYHSIRVETGKSDTAESETGDNPADTVEFPIELEDNVNGGVAAIEDQVYALVDDDPVHLARVNPSSAEIVETFDISNELGSGLTDDGTNLWIVDFNTDNVMKFNPETETVTVEFQASGDPAGVGFGAGSLWIGDIGTNTVYEYGPDGEQRSQFSIGSETTNAAGVAYYENELWVMDKDGTLYVYTTAGQLSEQHNVFSDLSKAAIDPSPWGIIGQDASNNISQLNIQ